MAILPTTPKEVAASYAESQHANIGSTGPEPVRAEPWGGALLLKQMALTAGNDRFRPRRDPSPGQPEDKAAERAPVS
jgi:hypothetical protein